MINLPAFFRNAPRLVWICLAFLLLVNLLVLGRALYNRLPPATAHITLSERELELPYRYGANSENSAVQLQLRWRTLPDDNEAPYWGFSQSLSLPAEEFAHLQFERCNPKGNRKLHRRQGWVLLELNGAAYTRYVQAAEARLAQHKAKEPDVNDRERWQQTARDLQSSLASAKHNDSRLFAIAASVQRHRLEAEQAAQQKAHAEASYLILPADIRDTYAGCSNTESRHSEDATRVTLELKTGAQLHVANIDAAPVLAKGHYQAVLSLGRLNELWLSPVQP